MKCNYCGSEINEGMRFCVKCGHKIERSCENNEAKLLFSEEKEWYCVVNNKHDAYSVSEIKEMYKNGQIDEDTSVCKEGLQDWIQLKESELYAQLRDPSAPPILKGNHVAGFWIWALAFAPLISEVVYYFFANVYVKSQIQHGNYNIVEMENTLQAMAIIIILGVNIFLSWKDEKVLQAAGYQTKILGNIALIPRYMFRRAKLLNQNNYYAICWIVCFVLTVLMAF